MMNILVAAYLAKPGMRDKMLRWHKLLEGKKIATLHVPICLQFMVTG